MGNDQSENLQDCMPTAEGSSPKNPSDFCFNLRMFETLIASGQAVAILTMIDNVDAMSDEDFTNLISHIPQIFNSIDIARKSFGKQIEMSQENLAALGIIEWEFIHLIQRVYKQSLIKTADSQNSPADTSEQKAP